MPEIPEHDVRPAREGYVMGSEIDDEIPRMGLRDFFAAHAIKDLIGEVVAEDPESVARVAYQIADAMLKVRSESNRHL